MKTDIMILKSVRTTIISLYHKNYKYNWYAGLNAPEEPPLSLTGYALHYPKYENDNFLEFSCCIFWNNKLN